MAGVLKEENKRRPSPVNPFATSSQEDNSPGPLDDAAAGAAASARGGSASIYVEVGIEPLCSSAQAGRTQSLISSSLAGVRPLHIR